MNILITEALGLIRSKLIYNLSQIKNLKKVYLIDNVSSNNLNILFNLKYKKIKLIFIRYDLINNNTFLKVKDKIDIVIHLASIMNAEGPLKTKKLMLKNNFGIFKKVYNFCYKTKYINKILIKL